MSGPFDWTDPSDAPDEADDRLSVDAFREIREEMGAALNDEETRIADAVREVQRPRLGIQTEHRPRGMMGQLAEFFYGPPDPETVERNRRAAARAERVARARAAQQYLIAAILAVLFVLVLAVGWIGLWGWWT